MRVGIGAKLGISSILILLVYTLSSFMLTTGILGLKDAMDESVNKSEQMNMLFRYNILSSRLTLKAKDLMIDNDKINSSQFMADFESTKSEIDNLMTEFLDSQENDEDRKIAIRVLGGSKDLLDLINNALVLPLQNGESINISLIDEALNSRDDILIYIDEQLGNLESEKLTLVGFGDKLASIVVRNSIIAVSIAIVLVIITLILLIRIIVSPVKKASDMLKTIAEGEGDLTNSLSVVSKDEIGELSSHFNLFLNRLKEIILNIKEGSQDNLKLEKQLKESSRKTEESIGFIKGNIDSIRDRFEALNNNISGSSEVVEEMSNSITSLN